MGRSVSFIGLVVMITLQTAAAQTLAQRWEQAVARNELTIIAANADRIDHIDRRTPQGKTALMAAARAAQPELVRQLLAAGADINARNHMGGTVLMFAAASGHSGIVELLLDRGADVNRQSVNGWSAIMMAAVKNHLDIVKQLRQRGADINLPDVYGWTPLMRAVYEGRKAVVAFLLEQPQIDLERYNDNGQTALHVAVIAERPLIVADLLARGARQRKDFAGRTPHSIAERLQNQPLLSLLSAQH